MNILGMIGLGYHPAACLLRDGRLVALAEEERFLRLKGAPEQFPANATKYCLNAAGIGLDDVDLIAFAWNMPRYRLFMPGFFVKKFLQNFGSRGEGNAADVLELLARFQPDGIRRKIRDSLHRIGIRGRMPRVEFLGHHRCHAASTFFASGFDESAILVVDGSGEHQCTTIFRGRGLDLEEMASFEIPNSLGWFYAAFTEFLGFIPYRDEGKVMGLAPYGRPREENVKKLDRVLRTGVDGSYEVDASFLLLGEHDYGAHFSNRMASLFGEPRYRNEPLDQRHKDLAWAVQDRLERAMLALTDRAMGLTGSERLCLAGGVALNCKMNGKLQQHLGGERLFVQPLAYDAGTALGAAMLASASAGHDPRFVQDHTYFGPGFTMEEIEAALQTAGVSYEAPADPTQIVAEAIRDNQIVALFQGRSEMGPRALGNRSILANACEGRMKDDLNRRAKFREPWRPFCPSVLESEKDRFIQGASKAPFMIVAYDVLEEKRESLPAVVHVDGSIRPQTVTTEQNQRFADIIDRVGTITGTPVVLNTSFNVRGEPIVLTPHDALRCFFSAGMDVLSIGDFIVRKPGSPPR